MSASAADKSTNCYNTIHNPTDSMKSTSVISAGILALGIVISGFCLKAGIDNIAFRDREVTVRGLAEREVEANLVTWPITYSLAGNNLQTIYDQVSGNNEKIVKCEARLTTKSAGISSMKEEEIRKYKKTVKKQK